MTTTVERDLSQPMRHLIHVRDHVIAADAPVAQGGRDAGPSPHDLYDAALGACIALTVVWFAKRRSIPVGPVQVRVDRDESGEREGIYRLAAVVELGGVLTDAQRQELLAAASKCPVHKLMTDVTTQITTTLA
jgi:putative redox protein